MCSHIDMHMNNLRGLSKVAKNLKQPRCLSVRGWINKLVIQTVGWDHCSKERSHRDAERCHSDVVSQVGRKRLPAQLFQERWDSGFQELKGGQDEEVRLGDV